ncbi:hypothetical protein Tco_0145988 [Tanacetum coccineum]
MRSSKNIRQRLPHKLDIQDLPSKISSLSREDCLASFHVMQMYEHVGQGHKIAKIRAFNINEPIYAELCHEFYSTYEFDEVCVSDELQTKKIIKFRLGARAHSLTLLEFARRLGLYQTADLDEDGFNVYLKGGLQRVTLLLSRTNLEGDSQDDHLWYANVAWLFAKWMKKKGDGTQKDSQICCGQFITKLARKCMVLTEDVVRSLSAPIYSGVTRVGILDLESIHVGLYKIGRGRIERYGRRRKVGWSIVLSPFLEHCYRFKLYEFAGDLLILELVLEIFMETPQTKNEEKGLTMQRNPVKYPNGRYEKNLEENL